MVTVWNKDRDATGGGTNIDYGKIGVGKFEEVVGGAGVGDGSYSYRSVCLVFVSFSRC